MGIFKEIGKIFDFGKKLYEDHKTHVKERHTGHSIKDNAGDVRGLHENMSQLESKKANGTLTQADIEAVSNQLNRKMLDEFPRYRRYLDEETIEATRTTYGNMQNQLAEYRSSFLNQKPIEASKVEYRSFLVEKPIGACRAAYEDTQNEFAEMMKRPY